jgi:chromosome segregation ATPase
MEMYEARNGKSLYRSQGSAPRVVHFFCSERGHSGGFSLNEQLRLLRELQDVDLELKAIQADKERYPIEIRNLDEKLALEKEMLRGRRERNESLEKERRQKEGDLELEQERMKKAQSKLYDVKTNKEYQALLAEIETLKEISSQREIEILEIMDEIDDVKREYAKMEKELLEMEKKIGAEKKNLEENLGKEEQADYGSEKAPAGNNDVLSDAQGEKANGSSPGEIWGLSGMQHENSSPDV